MTERWLYAWGLGAVAFGGASLLVPLYLVQLGGTAVDLGVLAATASAVGAPGAMVFGRLADRASHRRRLVLATLGGVAATLAAIPLLGSVLAVVLANAVLWLVVASVAPVLTMTVVDGVPESAWNERIGRLNKFQGYGWAGGLVLGVAWPPLGRALFGPEGVTTALFRLLAACAAVAAAGSARWLPAPAPGEHVTGDRAVRRVARLVGGAGQGIRGATFAFAPNRLYWTTRGLDPRRLLDRLTPALATYFLAALLFLTGSAAFWAPLPLFLTAAGFDTGAVFGLYLAAAVGSAVLYEGAGRLATACGERPVRTGGWAATFGYAVAFGVAGGPVLLGAGLVLSLRVVAGGPPAPADAGGAEAD